MKPAARTETKTIPWSTFELLHVDGGQLVYDRSDDGELIARFPGGGSTPLSVLIRGGCKVTLPERVR